MRCDPTGPDGDAERAFGVALVHLAAPLRRRERRLTRDATEAEDLLQDTMTRAWSARRSFEPGSNLQAWTFVILRNLWLSKLRRSRSTVPLDEAVVAKGMANDASQHQHAELQAVLRAIDRLPGDQREALCAVALEGLDYEAAADRSNISPAALKSRVRRARRALAQLIEEGPPALTRTDSGAGDPRTAAFWVRMAHVRGAWAAAKAAGKPLWIG